MMTKLSAIIITFNEERNIRRCIDSILPIADEIIVVDANSTDQTETICREKNVRFYSKSWQGYAETKNYGNDLATNDYVLSIDADEEITEDLQKSILQIKQAGFNSSDVYEVNRITNYCGKWIRHCGWYPEYKIRIFKKGIAKWRGTIHEELNFIETYKSKKLEGNLNHYSYPTIESHLKKMISYSYLAAQKDFHAAKKYNFILHGLLKPWFVFFKKYFFQMGFLDGYYGFVISVNSAFERFLRFTQYTEIKKNSLQSE